MNREEFDQLFDQAFDDAAHSSQFIPDPAPSWARIEKKLARRAKIKRRLKFVPAIAASFLLGAYIFGTPAVTTAFKPVIEAVSTIRDDVFEITIGRQNRSDATVPKTAPPPGFIEEGKDKSQDGLDIPGGTSLPAQHASMKEAAKHLVFTPPEVRYIPDAYEVARIETYREQNAGKSDLLSIQYNKKSGGGELYRIMIRKWQPNIVMKITSNPDVPTESLVVNGYEAYLQLTEDGSASIQYFTDELYIMITGTLARDDVLRIAESIRSH